MASRSRRTVREDDRVRVPAPGFVTLLVLGVSLVGPWSLVAATGSPLVDAGSSVKADIDQAFALDGHVEGFAASVMTTWTGPDECTILSPSALATSASCSTSGIHEFSLSADDGVLFGSDSVRMVVYDEWTKEYVKENGTTVAGALDVEVSENANASGIAFPFTVLPGTRYLEARLSNMTVVAEGFTLKGEIAVNGEYRGVGATNDLDLVLVQPNGEPHENSAGSSTRGLEAESVHVDDPVVGPWRAEIRSVISPIPDSWEIVVTGVIREDDISIPEIRVPRKVGAVGSSVTLVASTTGGSGPFSIGWETAADSRAFDDGAGTSFSFTFEGATSTRAKVTDGNGFESVAFVFVRDEDGASDRSVTVVAVVDAGFSPYHYEFLGHRHPWNVDNDRENDLDFNSDPSTYITDFPGAMPINITIPTSPVQRVDQLTEADAAEWAKFPLKKLVWFPGTKVVGAIQFAGNFLALPPPPDGLFTPDDVTDAVLPPPPPPTTNGAHGTRSAASAVGNTLGSCAECVVVLVHGFGHEALAWAASQPWIDIVSNSWGQTAPVYVDTHHLNETRVPSEQGQIIVFSSGNGLVAAPTATHFVSEKAGDWIIRVGSVSPSNEQTYMGSGKPADISSIGRWYPSTGGLLVNGTGTHDGTSSAAPVAAGHFAKVLHESRELLGDTSPGHASGIVASGTPVDCGPATPACALADGILMRSELRDLVYHNVLPSETEPLPIGQTVPSTQYAYAYQGHGVLVGRLDEARYEHDWNRMVAVAKGDAQPLPRPLGEENWFKADSKCRQKLWGAWSGGIYQGVEPTFNPAYDGPAMALSAGCEPFPHDTVNRLKCTIKLPCVN